MRTFRNSTTLSAVLLAFFGLSMTGCDSPSDRDRDGTVEAATGVEEGSSVQSQDVESRRVTIIEEKRVEDAETGEVLDQHVEKTPAEITEEVRVEREVKIDTGDTVITEQGDAPQ